MDSNKDDIKAAVERAAARCPEWIRDKIEKALDNREYQEEPFELSVYPWPGRKKLP